MTILAQLWLEEHRPTKFDFWLSERLRLPVSSGEVQRAEHTAERVVFTETLSDVLCNLVESGQLETETILQTVRMPAEAVWIEWPHFDMRWGVLLDEAPTGRVAVTCVAGKERAGREIIYAGTIERLPMPKGDRQIHLGFAGPGSVTSEKTKSFFGGLVMEALLGLFLLQQPKVILREEVEHSPTLQRARTKRGKLPLLEYVRLTIRIGATSRMAKATAGAASTGDCASRRRYHRVLGHFRVYGRETPNPHALWIEPYFRGDPSLGILLKERTLA